MNGVERVGEQEFERALLGYSIDLKTHWVSYPVNERIVQAYRDRINYISEIDHAHRFPSHRRDPAHHPGRNDGLLVTYYYEKT